MAMAVDSQQRNHLGTMGYDHMSYPMPASHFNNPWTAAPPPQNTTAQLFPNVMSNYLPNKPNVAAMPYSVSSAAPSGYATAYSQPELINQQFSRPAFETNYASATSAPVSSFAPTSAPFAPMPSFPPQSLNLPAQEDAVRRLSAGSSASVPQSQSSFGDAIEASQGMIAMSQSDITPRNIYGPRGDRGSLDYGFPSMHSSHSSISSASSYPHYYASSTADSTDYSSATESLDDPSSRILPRPHGIVGMGLPPAPQTMMGSFNSKVSTSTQKKHKCKVCDKRFTRPSSLQTHMYSHTGEKPFKCEVPGCGRNFSVVSNLRRHRKVHKGERGVSEEHEYDHEHDNEQGHDSPEGSWDSAHD